ncbi:hypothetical protein F5876DRAFT_78078 [Lentinula aff. lateritia]|uniref:Uncharacterized protein n=1 Tax=Lentinula aff. lateritia TaxID=2804960 RepID=A0ACC1TXM6_9AGAR|nr:hypothetical protein F5876DRAFT_78078 [Lentinula aff. lateritia]
MTSRLQSATLPAASGGFIGVEADWYGAQVQRELEQMKERGFRLVEWQAGKSVPLVDAGHHVMVCMLNGPDNPGYQQAVEEMMERILKASEETDWQKKEKRHKCGHFPALARGILHGKGQHEPMRLVGDRQPMMEELFDKSCFKRVAGFQNGAMILLPSALIRHSNFPLADRETQVSVTQYTAGGIRRWLEYGGRTEDKFRTQDPQGFAHTWAKRREGWTQGLNLFSTLDELKSSTCLKLNQEFLNPLGLLQRLVSAELQLQLFNPVQQPQVLFPMLNLRPNLYIEDLESHLVNHIQMLLVMNHGLSLELLVFSNLVLDFKDIRATVAQLGLSNIKTPRRLDYPPVSSQNSNSHTRPYSAFFRCANTPVVTSTLGATPRLHGDLAASTHRPYTPSIPGRLPQQVAYNNGSLPPLKTYTSAQDPVHSRTAPEEYDDYPLSPTVSGFSHSIPGPEPTSNWYFVSRFISSNIADVDSLHEEEYDELDDYDAPTSAPMLSCNEESGARLNNSRTCTSTRPEHETSALMTWVDEIRPQFILKPSQVREIKGMVMLAQGVDMELLKLHLPTHAAICRMENKNRANNSKSSAVKEVVNVAMKQLSKHMEIPEDIKLIFRMIAREECANPSRGSYCKVGNAVWVHSILSFGRDLDMFNKF